jgi:hypothetical protein
MVPKISSFILPGIAICCLITACDYAQQGTATAYQKQAQQVAMRNAAVLASAQATIPFASEFNSLFSGGQSLVSEGPDGWIYGAEVGLYGRYILKARVGLSVNTNTSAVIGSRSPELFLSEVTRITEHPSGGMEALFNPQQFIFSGEKWKQLVAAQGDFNAIGYSLVTNAPLTNFSKYCQVPGVVNRR